MDIEERPTTIMDELSHALRFAYLMDFTEAFLLFATLWVGKFSQLNYARGYLTFRAPS